MNQELQKMHFETITDAKARIMYDQLCAACEKRDGGMTDAHQMLVADCARAEQMKQMLIDDIAKRGLGYEKKNGRQTYWQKNDSVSQLRAYSEQQRKLLAELRLTPNSQKEPLLPIDDGFDDM